MKRRPFLELLAATAAGTLVSPRRLVAAVKLDHIGLELWSVRRAMQADPERTLAAVRELGYTDVELLWSRDNFGRTPAQVKATLDQLGLRAPSAHLAPETLLKDWGRSLDTAKLLGHEYLVVPSLPGETKNSLEAWRVWADRFNAAGAAARRAGIWLAFHNEPDHLQRIAHIVPYDLFVSRIDPSAVRLQLDVGNMLLGGGDPMRYLARHKSRYWSFHLKDVLADRKHDTELGAGTFDFKRFLAAVPGLAGKRCYAEQEEAVDEIESARRNSAFLRGVEF